MNNNIIQISRFALVVLLLGLTVLATAQIETNKKTISVEVNTSKPKATTQNTEIREPIGIIPNYEFVIEDDIMQSKDGEEEGGDTQDDDNNNLNGTLTNNGSEKNKGFTTSSINQITQAIKVYPVPAKTFTNIDLGEIKLKQFDIINSVGQRVYSQIVNQQFIRLDISNYQTGIYFIQMITTDNQVATKTLMVN